MPLVLLIVLTLHSLVELRLKLFDLLRHLVPHLISVCVVLVRGSGVCLLLGLIESLCEVLFRISACNSCLTGLCNIVNGLVRNLLCGGFGTSE